MLLIFYIPLYCINKTNVRSFTGICKGRGDVNDGQSEKRDTVSKKKDNTVKYQVSVHE